MKVPNMYPEVIEAILDYFVDEADVAADCLLYLSKINKLDKSYLDQLSSKAYVALEDMGRCTKCGTELQIMYYKEPHPELEGCPKEEVSEIYCPNCDIGILQ